MNGTKLSAINSIKDLGIDISYKLDWNAHINRVVKKCNKKMGLIMRTVGFKAPEKITKALYNALIRSDLEFGSCLWSGTSRHNIKCLEGVQRRATKFIMHYPDLDYRERLCHLGMLPLTLRREQLDLSLFFKCFVNTYDLDVNKHVKFYYSEAGQDHPTTRASADSSRLRTPICKTEAFKATFFNRIVPIWNQLPSSVRISSSFSVFKHNAVSFLNSRFESNFEPADMCTWSSVCSCARCRLV